jgi:ABC-type nitrate/sulfonate/bicarbonate transport system permease component
MLLRARYRIPAIQVAVIAGALVLFALSSSLYPFLPPLPALLKAVIDVLARKDAYGHFAITLYESLVGFGIAVVLGVIVGGAIGASRTATELFNPIILALYSIPKIIFLPLMLMIFGVGLTPKIANAALHAFFPIVLNSLVGMREIDRTHLKVARSMSATRFQLVRKLYLPSMVLPVFAGIRLGLGLAFMGALLAELFESKAGIGYYVIQFYSSGRIAEMIVIILAVFALILLINAGMQHVENRLSVWRRA